MLVQNVTAAVAVLAWVPWVPWNPSIFQRQSVEIQYFRKFGTLFLISFSQCTSNLLHTLTYLIRGHARLLILNKNSTLDTLIRASPFINFQENLLDSHRYFKKMESEK